MDKVTREEFHHALEDIAAFYAKKTEIEKLSNLKVDNTLTIPGMAADSAAVGEKIRKLSEEMGEAVSITHEWDGTTLIVTSASGTSSADLKGDKGDKGDTGKAGSNGSNGVSVTVSNVSESTADGGSNVVTFSDGTKLTVKNGSKGSTGSQGPKGDTGSKGDKGDKGDNGYTPVKGTDYFTTADKTELVTAVLAALPAAEGGSF